MNGAAHDVAIVGGGHNGLVCAAYLAARGLSVCVLERREVVGGAAVTEEFHPGFRNSTASYTVSLLDPEVIRDLRLAEHGLAIVERPFSNFLPLPGPEVPANLAQGPQYPCAVETLPFTMVTKAHEEDDSALTRRVGPCSEKYAKPQRASGR